MVNVVLTVSATFTIYGTESYLAPQNSELTNIIDMH